MVFWATLEKPIDDRLLGPRATHLPKRHQRCMSSMERMPGGRGKKEDGGGREQGVWGIRPIVDGGRRRGLGMAKGIDMKKGWKA